MSTCAACGTSDDPRGVNLTRGNFVLCSACRAEWEAQVQGTPESRALSFFPVDLRDSVLHIVHERITAEHERRTKATQEHLTWLLDLLEQQGIDPSDAAAVRRVGNLLRAGGGR